MAKSTHAQVVMTGTSDSYTEHEMSDPGAAEPIRVYREMIGGDPESVGTDSSESSENENPSGEQEKDNPRSPARTTENPSKGTEVGDSTADSTGGAGQRTTQPRSGRGKAARGKATSQTTSDEFD